MNAGQGSAARLINDGGFYEDLLENTTQLKLVLEEMKAFLAEWKDKELKITLLISGQHQRKERLLTGWMLKYL